MLRAISYVLTFSGGAVFGIAFLCLLQAGKGTLTEEVRKIIEESDVLIGATRMMEGFREKKKCCYAEYLPEKIRAILDEQEEKTRCTVLFSGDTGFYSGAKKLADILKKDGYEVQIFPGISSVIYLAAKPQEKSKPAPDRDSL